MSNYQFNLIFRSPFLRIGVTSHYSNLYKKADDHTDPMINISLPISHLNMVCYSATTLN